MATAQACPMPDEAPVTKARLPFSESDGVVGSFIQVLRLGNSKNPYSALC